METSNGRKAVIVGGGPAGLTAAYELGKAGIHSVVLEKDDFVGGLSRTAQHKGYAFDIGGHRFFTKVKAVEKLWREVLDDEDFLTCSRLSRIYYNKTFFNYPLKPTNALFGLGIWNSFMVLFSYIKARIFPERPEDSFEQWVSNRFGKRLYNTFFKTYTEKVWGIPGDQISADWAAQRIKELSFVTALKNAFLQGNHGKGGGVITTLIDAFQYPRRGPGMMWERVTELVHEQGGKVLLNSNVEKITMGGDGRVKSVQISRDGVPETIEGTDFVSSMPLRELFQIMDPPPPPEVLQAADKLRYRDFLTVAVIVDKEELFPDNWIYIHDPDVKVGRIQNFKNWSPWMVPDQSKSCLGLEYFCFEGDGLWNTKDEDLVALAARELELLGLLGGGAVEDGAVVRMPKAYPVYDDVYQEAVDVMRNYLDGVENLQAVGRNGMHKYNNQDHSMLTAMLAAKNIQGENHNLWVVNADADYHEEIRADEAVGQEDLAIVEATQPQVPALSARNVEALRFTFGKIHKTALGTALGATSGAGLFLATILLLLPGQEIVGVNIGLLDQFFPGYAVTWPGSVVGMGYGFGLGFLSGWAFGLLRNFCTGVVAHSALRREETSSLRQFMDYL